MAKSIKFNASWVDPGSYGLVKARTVVFELGLGPCGRHVTDLSHTINEGLLTVTQWSRDPEKLTAPCRNAAFAAEHKLERHQHASSGWEPMVTLRRPAETITSGWWIFKSTWTTHEKGILMPNPNRPEGLLTAAEVVAERTIIKDFWDAVRDWDNDVEIKSFVYKMADIHGRIEVLK